MSDITDTIRAHKQVRDNIKIAGDRLLKKGIEENARIAIVTNFVHESYCNPWTLEGAINPGPPAGTNGTGPGGGLGQWTPYQGKIKLGDWEQQINFLMSDKGQYIYPGNWGAYGYPMPANTPKTLDEYFKNPNKLSARDLNAIWVVCWERPAYAPGASRISTAKGDCSVTAQYMSKGNSVSGDPIPQWPYKYAVSFTQAPFQPEFDHKDTSAYDLFNSQRPQEHSNVIAPCDVTLVWADFNSATAIWTSDTKVYCADGKTGYLVIVMAHSQVPDDFRVGKKIKQGKVMFHLGNGGASTGVHAHFSVGRSSQKLGSYGDGWDLIPSQTGLGSDIRVTRSPMGNVSNAILPDAPAKNKLPNNLITQKQMENMGRVTANNIFSVTDSQKRGMTNQSEVYVNIPGFKYVQNESSGGGGGETPEPSKPKYRKQKNPPLAIFSI